MAARLRKELGVEVQEVAGNYGEFTVRVGEAEVVRAGGLGWLGVLPSAARVIAEVKRALSA